MKLILGVFFATVITMVLVVMFRLGAFKDVHVTEIEEGPLRLVYIKHFGPYHLIVPTMTEVDNWLKKNGHKCPMTFGEYLDDPEHVDHDRLQSHGGCVVPDDMTGVSLPPHFVYREIPRQAYITAAFTGAPSIAPYKVYPKVFEYFEKNKGTKFSGPILEIYRFAPGPFETRYLFPVDMTN